MANQDYMAYKASLLPDFEIAFAKWLEQIGEWSLDTRWQQAFRSFAFEWYVSGRLDAEIKNSSEAA